MRNSKKVLPDSFKIPKVVEGHYYIIANQITKNNLQPNSIRQLEMLKRAISKYIGLIYSHLILFTIKNSSYLWYALHNHNDSNDLVIILLYNKKVAKYKMFDKGVIYSVYSFINLVLYSRA